VTTAGVIAVREPRSTDRRQVSRATAGRLTIGERAELVELLALRSHVLGRITDAERAAALADELASQMPGDPRSFVARARMSAVFHRFRASPYRPQHRSRARGRPRRPRCGGAPRSIRRWGRYDEALTIRRLIVDRHADFSALAALAGVHGDRGETDKAERWFRAATRCYHGTSPFPLAIS